MAISMKQLLILVYSTLIPVGIIMAMWKPPSSQLPKEVQEKLHQICSEVSCDQVAHEVATKDNNTDTTALAVLGIVDYLPNENLFGNDTYADQITNATKPDWQEPWFLVIFSNPLSVIVNAVVFKKSVRFGPPAQSRNFLTQSKIITYGTKFFRAMLIVFVIAAIWTDVKKVFLACHGLRSFLLSVAPILITSSNYKAGLAIWSALGLESPGVIMGLQPNYACRDVFLLRDVSFPRKFGATSWCPMEKQMYALLLYPYAILRPVGAFLSILGMVFIVPLFLIDLVMQFVWEEGCLHSMTITTTQKMFHCVALLVGSVSMTVLTAAAYGRIIGASWLQFTSAFSMRLLLSETFAFTTPIQTPACGESLSSLMEYNQDLIQTDFDMNSTSVDQPPLLQLAQRQPQQALELQIFLRKLCYMQGVHIQQLSVIGAMRWAEYMTEGDFPGYNLCYAPVNVLGYAMAVSIDERHSGTWASHLLAKPAAMKGYLVMWLNSLFGSL